MHLTGDRGATGHTGSINLAPRQWRPSVQNRGPQMFLQLLGRGAGHGAPGESRGPGPEACSSMPQGTFLHAHAFLAVLIFTLQMSAIPVD